MITVTIHGAGGWLSVLLWLGMAIGVPTYCFFMGRTIGRDQIRDQIDQQYHDEWMAENALPKPGRLVPVPADEQVLEVTRELPDGTTVRSRYVPAPMPDDS